MIIKYGDFPGDFVSIMAASLKRDYCVLAVTMLINIKVIIFLKFIIIVVAIIVIIIDIMAVTAATLKREYCVWAVS